MNDNLFAQPAIIFLFVVWIAFALFMIWYVITSDGWRHLTPKYRTDRDPSGKTWQFQTGYIGGGNYRNNLTITTNDEGLFLEVTMLNLAGRPRLFIPWHDFHNATVNSYFFWRNVQVDIGNPPLTRLRLPVAVFAEGAARKVVEPSIGTNVPT